MDTAKSSAHDDSADGAVPPRRPSRRIRANDAVEHLRVTSDFEQNEPVTDAEIRLIMAALGDTIGRLMNRGDA